MPVPSRLDRYVETEKQRHFSRDFMVGWEAYETWDEATVGQNGPAQRTFEITEEDILDYNRACGETDPLMIDPDFARKHSPTGELLQHPAPTPHIRDHDSLLLSGREGNRHLDTDARRTQSPAAHRDNRTVPLWRNHHINRHDGRQVHAARKTLSADAPRFSEREGRPQGALVVFVDPSGDARRCRPLRQCLTEEFGRCQSCSGRYRRAIRSRR